MIGDLIPRHVGDVISKATNSFSVIIVTGARQVGKSTLLRTISGDASYYTLDSLTEYDAAINSPEEYIETRNIPAIIDEIQYAPNLFRAMKSVVDEAKFKGNRKTLFLATGSQRFPMIKGASESLAGRAYTIEMLGVSQREIERTDFKVPFTPTKKYVDNRQTAKHLPESNTVWDRIFRGDMPELAAIPALDSHMFYEAYTNTYIRRDVRDLSQVGSLTLFNRFMQVLATLCGKQLNKAAISRELDISQPTVDRWLSILEASGIIYLLPPYYRNIKKRLVKSPKLYFTNTGLACHLCGIASSSVLADHAMAGHFFENYTIIEIVKSYLNHSGSYPELYFYRDSHGKEIDLLVATPEGLHPIEIKASRSPRTQDTASFAFIEEVLNEKRLSGAVISGHEEILPLGKNDLAIPISFL